MQIDGEGGLYQFNEGDEFRKMEISNENCLIYNNSID